MSKPFRVHLHQECHAKAASRLETKGLTLDTGQIKEVIEKNIFPATANSRVLKAIPGGFALLRHSNRKLLTPEIFGKTEK